MSDRRETALAEIERRLDVTFYVDWGYRTLEGHKATLERHRVLPEMTACHWCRYESPCPDAAHVLDLYAPEADQ